MVDATEDNPFPLNHNGTLLAAHLINEGEYTYATVRYMGSGAIVETDYRVAMTELIQQMAGGDTPPVVYFLSPTEVWAESGIWSAGSE